MNLTDVQRRALHQAARKGGAHIAPVFQAVPRDQIQASVASRLRTLDLVTVTERSRVVLTRGERSPARVRLALITKTGRAALAAPVPESPPVFLKQRDGLTSRRDLSVRGEDEVIDPATLKSYWAEEGARKHAEAMDRRQAARDLANRARRAA